MFWIISDENVKTSSYLSKQKNNLIKIISNYLMLAHNGNHVLLILFWVHAVWKTRQRTVNVLITFLINPLMTTPRRNQTLFTEIKFCTLWLTIISCFEKISMWHIGKVENIAVTYTWHWTYGLQIAGILGKC